MGRITQEVSMDKDEMEGAAEKAKGKAKEVSGDLEEEIND
jgi:uncharacterized protein YjbJ (UPF0337 family)